MKKLLLTVFLALAWASSAGASNNVAARDSVGCDSPDTAVLMKQLEAYLAEVDKLSIADACTETDFIISSVADSALRNAVGVKVYKHFRASKYMCADNIAIHVYDSWFAKFRLVFDTLDDFDQADFHSFVNRSSLIGKKASELEFPYGRKGRKTLPAKGRKTVVLFYSTECPKCLYTALKLKEYVQSNKPKVALYLIYTGNDREKWMDYRERVLDMKRNCRTMVYNIMGGDVDYVVPYSVVQTPRLFLIDEKGVIAGRMLDVDALSELLEMQCE